MKVIFKPLHAISNIILMPSFVAYPTFIEQLTVLKFVLSSGKIKNMVFTL